MDCSHIRYSPGVSSIFFLYDKFETARSVIKFLSCSIKLQFDFHISGLMLEKQTVTTLSGWYTCIVLRSKSDNCKVTSERAGVVIQVSSGTDLNTTFQ